MVEIRVSRGRISIDAKALFIGEDLCVMLSGGDSPHIGCVTLSVPRPSLCDPGSISATTSVLNLLGHKDDEAARYVSQTLSSRLNRNVAATCGIHVDGISVEEIEAVMELVGELTDKLSQNLKR